MAQWNTRRFSFRTAEELPSQGGLPCNPAPLAKTSGKLKPRARRDFYSGPDAATDRAAENHVLNSCLRAADLLNLGPELAAL